MNERMSVARRQIERVSQEINTKTRDLAADLTEHITQTNNDVAFRQEMADLGEQISSKFIDGVKTVTDNVIECRNQILAEKESSLLNFQKANKEIETLDCQCVNISPVVADRGPFRDLPRQVPCDKDLQAC
jgi:hypothetical protein